MRRVLRIFLVWLVVWPLVMAGLVILRTIGPDWPMALRTLVLTGVLVPLIALGITPVVAWLISRLHWQERKGPGKTGAL
ncbi:hypothetical protein [Roseovarius atlanticus]|uniref:hypothetical protein n=1 Tax=Roseovarius atlanticus TaxID=1641875 RepID=UPI001C985188|nr:hypothetical protein [Roseovarius atlanticus]MBY5989365.1 hypothetical protein [Roseovarius atlanticus]MBY6124757.1 hypothetical protein [Roseovarius atlanticus]MBY6149252.1 hypothetical protein [Roseovarius atlanticus]